MTAGNFTLFDSRAETGKKMSDRIYKDMKFDSTIPNITQN